MSLAPAAPSTFRDELLAWLAAVERPPGLHDYGPTPTPEDVAAGRAWQLLLAEAGYACLHWPVEHGGRAATVQEQAVFAEEMARARLPRQLNIIGPDLVGPVLMRFGTARQKERFLPRIRTGADLWCQLFSEPDAGSDLASVHTCATRTVAGWVVTGQKVWTSAGTSADFGLMLARSGAGRSGLSAFIVNMRSAGVHPRPLLQMDGDRKFSEVFLDDVLLDADAIVGSPGEGWKVATATLGRERLSLGAGCVGLFAAVEDLGAAVDEADESNAAVRESLAGLWLRVWLLRATWLRALATGDNTDSAAFSVLKLMSSTLQRDIGEFGLSVLGNELMTAGLDHKLVHRLLISPAQTLLGGTTEIQRNILAQRVLGLPR